MLPKDWDEMKGIVDALLKGLIGTTKDTGGSQTAGTVMGKENAILTKAAAISTAVSQIGSAGDTGGSATAGTVFAKENAILTHLKEIQENKYACLKVFSAQVGTSDTFTTEEGYRYHTKSLTLPANIRIIGIYAKGNGSTGANANMTIKIGSITFSDTVFTTGDDFYRYLSLSNSLGRFLHSSATPTTPEVAAAAALVLGLGIRTDNTPESRQLVLTFRYGVGLSNQANSARLEFYYVEE